MKEELLNGLTEEQIAKVKACKSQSELLKLAENEGIELTSEQLEAVNGGNCVSTPNWSCPRCESKDIKYQHGANRWFCTCRECGYEWNH